MSPTRLNLLTCTLHPPADPGRSEAEHVRAELHQVGAPDSGQTAGGRLLPSWIMYVGISTPCLVVEEGLVGPWPFTPDEELTHSSFLCDDLGLSCSQEDFIKHLRGAIISFSRDSSLLGHSSDCARSVLCGGRVILPLRY